VTEQYFPAADISVTYALGLARRFGGIALGEIEQAYMSRIGGREAYKLVLSI
jgi:glutathione S-transferase